MVGFRGVSLNETLRTHRLYLHVFATLLFRLHFDFYFSRLYLSAHAIRTTASVFV